MQTIHTTQQSRPSLTATIVLALSLIQMMASFGAEEHWDEMAPMPTERWGLSVVEYEGTLFAIGGTQSSGSRLSTVEQYDSSTNSWTSRADMPTARKNVAAAVVDGKIYVFGGTQAHANNVIKTTEAYDPATDTWMTLTDMPTARLGLTAVPVDGKIYVIGGWGVGSFQRVVEAYDPATDTWETKAPLPSAIGNGGFAGFEGKVYMFGGTRGPNRITGDTQVYDPVADQWETKASMPSARLFPSATVLDGKFYVLGSNWPTRDTVDVYDPGTDTWAEGLSMPTARGGLSAVTLNGKIYAIGGHTGITWGSVGTVYDTVEVYTPATFTLTIPSRDGGTIIASPEMEAYQEGTVVTLTATPDEGYAFAGWEGDTNEEANPLTITLIMDSDKNVAATFLEQQSAGDGIWTTKSPMPRARLALSSSVVDGKIYAIGGGPGQDGMDWVEEYDPGTDTWAPKAGMPTARRMAASSVVNGKIYVIGGSTSLFGAPLSTVEQYDPATDTWTTKANMPTARAFVSSSVVDGKIYVLGGARTFRGTALSTVEQYDPATDTWTTKAEMPTARNAPSASVVSGRIYVIGGAPGGGQWFHGLSTVEEYDPATDTWAPKADMPTARLLFSTSVVKGRVYAIGGYTDGLNGRFSTVEEYDPAKDSWAPKADMPTARNMLTTSVVNGKIYAVGGSIGSVLLNVATVEEYDPISPSPIDEFTLTIQQSDNGTATKTPELDSYPSGMEVTLTATPSEGYAFTKWFIGEDGEEELIDNPLTVIIGADTTVSPEFAEIPATFTLTIPATDGGTVVASPEIETYQEGTTVTLTATPNEGYAFAGWEGDTNEEANPLTITLIMDSDKNVAAKFRSVIIPEIVGVVFDPVARSVNVTWLSQPDAIYEIEVSADLVAWEALETKPGTGEQTTAVLDSAPNGPNGERQRFYRLREKL
jgi:N-acetylneuraminic acid mutarotase